MSMQAHPKPAPARTAGFSLVEMLIVVAVLVVLASMTAPPLVGMLQRNDIQQEEQALEEIKKAMEVYLRNTGSLPNSAITNPNNDNHWTKLLSRHSNLSPNQMLYDTWGSQRMYIATSVSETLFGTDFPIWYASVHSPGVDRKVENTPGVAFDKGQYGAPNSNGWWSNNNITNIKNKSANIISSFSQMDKAGDDMLVKLSDYDNRMQAYATTLERLNAISKALETYSRSAYGERVLIYATDSTGLHPDQQVFYPRSASPVGSDTPALYANTRGNEDINGFHNANFVYNGTNNALRRDGNGAGFIGMVELMRILGLPDEYCCSALETYGTDANGQPLYVPFYYFSNPRPRRHNNQCLARPGPTDRKLPARVTTTYVPDGQAGATCG